jgi:hypothetical protein
MAPPSQSRMGRHCWARQPLPSIYTFRNLGGLPAGRDHKLRHRKRGHKHRTHRTSLKGVRRKARRRPNIPGARAAARACEAPFLLGRVSEASVTVRPDPAPGGKPPRLSCRRPTHAGLYPVRVRGSGRRLQHGAHDCRTRWDCRRRKPNRTKRHRSDCESGLGSRTMAQALAGAVGGSRYGEPAPAGLRGRAGVQAARLLARRARPCPAPYHRGSVRRFRLEHASC